MRSRFLPVRPRPRTNHLLESASRCRHGSPAVRYQLRLGQPHLFLEGSIARIALQAPQKGVAPYPGEPTVAQGTCPFQPLERLIVLASEGQYLGNLERVDRVVFCD